MKESRRNFLKLFVGTNLALLAGGLSALDALAASSPKESPIFSSFKIKFSHGKELRKYFSHKRLTDYLPKTDKSAEWIRHYDELRKQYIKDGRLLETSKVIKRDTAIFVNKWKSKQDFENFCKECDFNYLLNGLSDKFVYDYKTSKHTVLLADDSEVLFHQKYA